MLAFAAQKIIGLRIGEYEFAQGQPEFANVAARDVVPGWNAHGARFTVETIGKSKGARTPANVLRIRLEYRHPMSRALQLVSRAETGEARADDHHVQLGHVVDHRGERRQRRRDGRATSKNRNPAQEFAP